MRRKTLLITLALGSTAVAAGYVLAEIGRYINEWAQSNLSDNHPIYDTNVEVDGVVSMTNGGGITVRRVR